MTALIRFPADFSLQGHNTSKKSISYNLDPGHKYFEIAVLAMAEAVKGISDLNSSLQ